MSNSDITPSTFLRNLNHGTHRKLADFLDPLDTWKRILVDIQNKSTGQPRYTQLHFRRFEGLMAKGKSPTVELLYDWGTANATVGELVDLLVKHKLFAPADLLLPDVVSSRPVEAVTGLVGLCQKTVALESKPRPEESVDPGFSRFSYHELMKITGNWDDRPTSMGGNKLGEGGFGIVYKGCLNNTHVAVKKLNMMDDISPDELQIQFNQEIQTLMVLEHENLVNMVGFSCDTEHPCLVYAYMPNGSLLDRLACLDNTPPLSWHRRYIIAVGTAKGLEYLHSNHHVHRDVKSANILLDEKLVSKISDFGLTRASAKRTSTTVMTEKVVGTTAYMAPEALRGEITPKSDIYSFGVVLLEIISGLPPVDEERKPKFLMEVKDEIEDEEMELEDLVDKKMDSVDLSSVEKIFGLACHCLNDKKGKRPSMEEVLRVLKDDVIVD
ncbi:interleukin-1 receptor-associated kinase 4 isoform X1 [Alosa sapidissima]|uniref:interleukin-1 receptor-associated kinase 4 isoform X1 n=1 Tax=Alosa sapidissima TaxID=34773 RepID=UPI001C091BAB|nr:interleukin-1 receptor-associated kinase 4 isoform X1 [Alosa sapidissima]